MIQKLSFVVFFVLGSLILRAQNINLTGGWYTEANSNTILKAGDNYPSNYSIESALNQTLFSLTHGGLDLKNSLNGWRIDVKKQDINWHSNLILEIRRSSSGVGSDIGNISGGDIYQRVDNRETRFFNGVGSYTGVGLMYRISGFSVLIPAESYSTTIILTVIDF